jgi:copper chaperone
MTGKENQFMTTLDMKVQNVKCGGCVKTIQEGLAPLAGIDSVQVDIATGTVSITGDSFSVAEINASLAALGYPVVD